MMLRLTVNARLRMPQHLFATRALCSRENHLRHSDGESRAVESVEPLKCHPTYRAGVPRVLPCHPDTNAKEGTVAWDAKKSLWNFSHLIGFSVGAAFTTTDCSAFVEGFSVFFATTGVSVLFGHSLGMHRLWIHRSYDTFKPVEYALVHLGTIMGQFHHNHRTPLFVAPILTLR